MSNSVAISKIELLEAKLLQCQQILMPLVETLVAGHYVRELLIPAGTILTSRVWLEDYVDIMVSGKIIVAGPAGSAMYTGYNEFDGKAGRKRAGFALEDTYWISIHKTQAKSTDNLLEQLSVPDISSYLKHKNILEVL